MGAFIKAISYFLPERIVTNNDLKKENPNGKIDESAKIAGVEKRHVVATDEYASDLAYHAALNLFSEQKIKPEEIDFLVFCSQSPDYVGPSTSILLQHKLGIPTHCGAIDLNMSCSGFIYGLSLVKGLIETRVAKNVLLLTAESITHYIHPKDISSRVLFGDAGAATLISENIQQTASSISGFILGTDGSGADKINLKYGASKFPLFKKTYPEYADSFGNIRTDCNFYMNGTAIFNSYLKNIPLLVHQILKNSGLSINDIDWFVFNQASRIMLETVAQKMKIPLEKVIFDMENKGDTVSSSIPIAIAVAMKEKKIIKGNRVLLAAFGMGYSWGATIVNI